LAEEQNVELVFNWSDSQWGSWEIASAHKGRGNANGHHTRLVSSNEKVVKGKIVETPRSRTG